MQPCANNKAGQLPIAILVTFSQEMMKSQGGPVTFTRYFLKCMELPETVWLSKCTNLPKHEVAWVYIIIGNRIRYRANFVGYAKGPTEITKASGAHHTIDWPRVMMTGPLTMAPRKIHRQGFQGFRYVYEEIF